MKVPSMCLVYSWHGSSVKLCWSGNHNDSFELFHSCPIWELRKNLVAFYFPQMRRFHFASLLMSWWRPNQFKPLRWGWLKVGRGWVLGRFLAGTLWEPLKQVSANCSSFEAAVIGLQNLMKLLGFPWGNLDVKDNCLTVTGCSVGRTYSHKYF